MSGPLILGLESSCDETSAALVQDGRILGHVILSQDVHRLYGGVVPELAARAHLAVVDDVVQGALQEAGRTLDQVDAIGVTSGPGLIGALLVGVCWARAAAFALDLPVLPIHHMEAHLFAPSLEDPEAGPPFVALLVSGGHTLLLHARAWGDYQLLGETRDDAAGEAYDKVARVLSLPYPGGPQVERLAKDGNPARYPFPRPMVRGSHNPHDPNHLDVSFSGLKTAVATQVSHLAEEGRLDEERAHVAAGFQAAVVDTLATKTLRAVELTGCRRVLLGGGVSANKGLRDELRERLGADGTLLTASPRLSLDNGAMVAQAAAFHLEGGQVGAEPFTAHAGLPFPGLKREPVVATGA